MPATLPRLAISVITLGLALILGGGILGYQIERHTFRDCVYPSIHIVTWLDANANGIREPEELPLGNVWISIPLNDGDNRGGITDQQGVFIAPDAMTSCDGDTWNTVMASPPGGYRATTETRIRHFASRYEFGFQALPIAP